MKMESNITKEMILTSKDNWWGFKTHFDKETKILTLIEISRVEYAAIKCDYSSYFTLYSPLEYYL